MNALTPEEKRARRNARQDAVRLATAQKRGSVALTRQTGRKNSAAVALPVELNTLIGRRLESIREARGYQRQEIPIFAHGSLANYELRNASTMKLGDLIAYAEFLKLDLIEFFTLLLVNEDGDQHQPQFDVEHLRVLTLMRALSPGRRAAALDMLQALTKIE